MSAQMTAPITRVYGDETPKAAPPAAEASERDSKFQTFMSKLIDSLHESDVSSRDQREKADEFDAMNAYAGRQMKDDAERVVQHQQGPAVAVAATMAQPNPHAAREMNALLKTEQASKPIDGPKNTNTFANNAESASKGAENKAVAAERGADKLMQKANDLAAKMNPQDVAAMAAKPKDGGIGAMAVEVGLHAKGYTAAAVAVGVASAVSTGQGQGTYSTEKTASKPILSKSEQRAQAKTPSYYYDQAPQAIAAPSQPTNTAQFFDKMGKGPGFGNDLTARSTLASQNLDGLKLGKIVEDSPAMKSIKSAGIDADKTKTALLDMKGKGLVDDGGKQTVKEELQAFVKPTAPSPPGFRA